jgi:microcystin-dependent protein
MNLSGTFALANQIPSSTTINGYIGDLTDEITNSMDRDGKAIMRAAMKMGGFKITGLADGSLLTDAVTVGQMTTAAQGGVSSVATTVAGTADAITAAFTPPFPAYATNMQFFFKATGPNTVTAPTINLDGLGIRTIKRQGGAALALGDIPAAGYICECFYDGTDVILLNPQLNAQLTVLTGLVFDWAGATAPAGYLLCDGAAVSRTTYAALFAVIGGTYGVGNGSTTFNVPDCRGRASIGVGTGSGLTFRALGGQIGEENHLLSIAEMPSHNHQNFTALQAGNNIQGGSNWNVFSSVTGNTGGGGVHNNMQPSIGLNKIIKT